MTDPESVDINEGNVHATLRLNWDELHWTSATEIDEGCFPFVAEVHAKRYEFYSDGSFDEEELDD
jgi:hypothetical protein